jgi:hypothetical protein
MHNLKRAKDEVLRGKFQLRSDAGTKKPSREGPASLSVETVWTDGCLNKLLYLSRIWPDIQAILHG